jgi:hypothetical protein
MLINRQNCPEVSVFFTFMLLMTQYQPESLLKGSITRCVFRGVFAVRQTVCRRGMQHWCTTMGLSHPEKVTLMSDGLSYIKDATKDASRNRPIKGQLHGAFSMCVFMSDKPFDAEACDIGGHASATNGLSDIKTHIKNATCNRPLTVYFT